VRWAAHRRGHAPNGPGVVDPDGLNPIALLKRALACGPRVVSGFRKMFPEWLEQSRADVFFFESSSLNPQSGQPATDHLKAALNHGRRQRDFFRETKARWFTPTKS